MESASQQPIRLIQERSAFVFAFSHDAAGRFAYLSENVWSVLGYTPQELIGQPWDALHAGEADDRLARRGFFATGTSVGEAPSPHVVGVRHALGHRVFLLICEAPAREDDEVVGVEGLALDVTHLIQSGERFRMQDEVFRYIAEHIREVFWIKEPGATPQYVSPAFQEIWGVSPELCRESPDAFLRFIHPEDRDRVREALDQQVEGSYDETYRIIRPNGEIRWIRDRAFPVREESGEVHRLVGVAEDVTHLKKSVDDLNRRLARYQKAGQISEEVGWEMELRTERITWSTAGGEPSTIATDTPEEVNHWLQRIHPEDVERVVTGLDAVIGGTSDRFLSEFRFGTASGAFRRVLFRAWVEHSPHGRPHRLVGSMLPLGREEERAAPTRAAQHACPESETRATTPWVIELVRDIPSIGAQGGDLLIVDPDTPERISIFKSVDLGDLPASVATEVKRVLSAARNPPSAAKAEAGSRSLRERASHLRLIS